MPEGVGLSTPTKKELIELLEKHEFTVIEPAEADAGGIAAIREHSVFVFICRETGNHVYYRISDTDCERIQERYRRNATVHVLYAIKFKSEKHTPAEFRWRFFEISKKTEYRYEDGKTIDSLKYLPLQCKLAEKIGEHQSTLLTLLKDGMTYRGLSKLVGIPCTTLYRKITSVPHDKEKNGTNLYKRGCNSNV